MKILFISKMGDGLGVADRLTQEGHDVRFWTEDRTYARDLTGLISRVETWRPSVTWSDFVICDMVGYSQHLPTFSRYGKPTLSCNAFGDVLELNRLKGLHTATAIGMLSPESWTYPTPMEAKLHQIEGKTVVKPNSNQSSGKTRVVETQALYEWALDGLKADEEVLVQRYAEGIEVSTEGWFNGVDWVTPFNHTFEEKKLLAGGSLHTGCMGNLVVPAGRDHLVLQTLIPLTPYLRKAGYRGPLDVNCICTKDDALFLEYTARMGYDAIEALATGLKEPLGGFLFEIATGVKKEADLTKDYMVAVRLCTAPYPFPGKTEVGIPLEGIISENRKYIYLSGIQKRGGRYFTSGSDGVLGKVTARGRTITEARNRVYRTLGDIKGIDLFYRDDIGLRAEGDIKQLQQWGWL